MNSVFRREAVSHATNRLAGQVVLATPLSLRLYGVLCLAVLIAAGIYLTLASYSREESVIGWLVPRGGLIRVAARSGGTIEHLLVKEGEVVRAGQPIAQIRLSTAIVGGEDAGAATGAALNSENQAIEDQAVAARNKLLDEQAELGPKLNDLKAQLAEIRRQIVYQQEQVQISETDFKRFQKLAADGVIAERLVDDRRSALLSAEQNLSQLRSNALTTQQQIADATTRLQTIPADIAAATANAQSASAEITQKKIQNSAQSLDLAVASISGHVLAIPVEQGQSLSSGATIAIITPKGAHLEAELYAPSRAIGFIRPGQTVHLMYQAFPHEKFGTARGTITSISRTILSPADVSIPGTNVQQPVFRVRAALIRQGVYAYGQFVPLQPGMLLTADVVVDRRTLLQWLLDPIYAVQR